MRVLILNPPSDDGVPYIREGRCMQSKSSWTALFPPLTLMYISSMLRARGHDVRLVDAIAQEVPKEEVLSMAADFKPDVLVLNTAFPSIHGDMGFARICADRVPGMRSVAIGMFPTVLPRESMEQYPWIDYVVQGEPEDVVCRLVDSLSQGQDPRALPSLGWRQEGAVHISSERHYIDDLDVLPLPDRVSVNARLFRFPLTDEPLTMINFARGCPYSCIYCLAPLYYGKKYRRRSASSMLDEIKSCVQDHGIRNFIFWGELVSFHPDHLRELCNGILDAKLDILWMAAARADQLEPELLALMKRSGCHMVTLGLESASQEILNQSRKAIRLDESVRGIQMLRQAGIKAMGHFVVGLPGETEKTARETLAFAKKHCDYAQFYCAVPYPGTELADLAEREGWLQPADWADYDFTHSIMERPEMTAQRMEELRRQAFMELYMRPQIVWSNLRQMRWPALAKRLGFKDWMAGRK